jgi:cell fate (sporulation/competence/biofilm development) regulator YlbF (YheA/YmcA/DUF963 family)
LGFCGANFDINGVIKMKKYTFKGILLALGLVLATLSMQVGARDAGTDTDARADALWQTQLALTNAASTTARDALVNVNTVLDSNVDFSAQTAAVDALKWALVAFKVEIDALDLLKRTKADASVILAFRMTFNNYQQALQVKNSELEVKIQQSIADAEARRVAQLWQDKLTLTNTALATATSAEVDANNAVNGDGSFASKEAAITVLKEANAAFDVAIQALDSVKRDKTDATVVAGFNDQLQTLQTQASALEATLAAPWLTQLALTNTALTTASNAVIEANSVLASTVDFPVKTAAIEASKQANEAFRLAIQALDTVKRDQDDGVIVTTFNNQHQALQTQITELEVALAAAIEAKRVADLAAPWQAQLTLTDSALLTANTVVANATSVMNSDAELSSKTTAVEASKQANAAFNMAIRALDSVKRDEADATVVAGFNDQLQTLQTQTSALEAALVAAPWLTQLALTNTALTTASNAVIEASSVLVSTVDFPVKTAAIEASKQANEAFRLAIQALDAIKRDQDDGVIVATFNNQHQALKTQITELEVALAAAIEAKRVADLSAPWQAQLALTDSALITANTVVSNAASVMNSDAELSSKTTVVEASKQANAAFISAIQALKLVERDATDGAVTTAFNDQYQTLLTQTTALEATLAASEEKRVFDEATLTGYWKFPVIKGLNYQTTTHPSGITDETGAFKCQPGEVVAFSIENLSLTQVDCQAVLQTKMTKSVSLNVASTGDGFKDWQDEEGKQVIITKVLFGLFNDNIKTAFAQADEALKFITVKLTEVQKGNTANQSLDANDLSVMVQDVLGTTEAVVLPTTEQATNMVTSGWQANKVFDAVDTKDKADTEDKADTDASKKSSSGGGCVYNPNATGRADVGFILLMVLSVYYLVRRKRLTT